MASILDRVFNGTSTKAISSNRIRRQLARTLCSIRPDDVFSYAWNMVTSSGKSEATTRVAFMLREMERGNETRDDAAAEVRGQYLKLSQKDWTIGQWNTIQALRVHKFQEELPLAAKSESSEVADLKEQVKLLKELLTLKEQVHAQPLVS